MWPKYDKQIPTPKCVQYASMCWVFPSSLNLMQSISPNKNHDQRKDVAVKNKTLVFIAQKVQLLILNSESK